MFTTQAKKTRIRVEGVAEGTAKWYTHKAIVASCR